MAAGHYHHNSFTLSDGEAVVGWLSHLKELAASLTKIEAAGWRGELGVGRGDLIYRSAGWMIKQMGV
jgi:hypothetical protein